MSAPAEPGDVTHEWAVRWPASIHDTEDVEPCDDRSHAERVARGYSTEDCVGEVVVRTVTRSPWRPAGATSQDQP